MIKKIKILTFRTDKIGDLINTSPFLKSLKKHYSNCEIHLICSAYNSFVAQKYEFIDKVIIYNKNQSFLDKIKFFLKIITNYYDICITIDGKTISKLISLFLKSKQKYIICFKKKKKFFGIKRYIFSPSLFICKKFYNTYIICDEEYDKPNVNSDFNNHYLTMYYFLLKKNNINLTPEKHAFILDLNSKKIFDNFFTNFIKKNFLTIHIDYKWDAYNIDLNQFSSILNNISQKKKIVITSGVEGSKFFENLKKHHHAVSFKNDNFNYKPDLINHKILLIENISLNLLACFLEKSLLHVSSHSGSTIHISAAFNKPIIDFIKKDKISEYNRWIPPGIDYSRVMVNKLDDLENLIINKI